MPRYCRPWTFAGFARVAVARPDHVGELKRNDQPIAKAGELKESFRSPTWCRSKNVAAAFRSRLPQRFHEREQQFAATGWFSPHCQPRDFVPASRAYGI
jgi:hypothetical protein